LRGSIPLSSLVFSQKLEVENDFCRGAVSRVCFLPFAIFRSFSSSLSHLNWYKSQVAVANAKTTPIVCREGGITEQTYYRWRKEFGGLQVDKARRLKELEPGNAILARNG
jgi:hypothetical protein